MFSRLRATAMGEEETHRGPDTQRSGEQNCGIPQMKETWFLSWSQASHWHLNFRHPTSGISRGQVSIVVSHRVCETRQSSPGQLRRRLEAATPQIRNHELIRIHSSFSLVSPLCTRVRRVRGILLPPQPASPHPTFKIKTSQS